MERLSICLPELQARTQGDGIICGIGTVDGRAVAAMAVDYMVLAGTQGFNHHRKMDRLIDVAGRDNWTCHGFVPLQVLV